MISAFKLISTSTRQIHIDTGLHLRYLHKSPRALYRYQVQLLWFLFRFLISAFRPFQRLIIEWKKKSKTKINKIKINKMAICSSDWELYQFGSQDCIGRRIDPSWWTYFSFQPVLHDWSNNGCDMCYPVSGMVNIKYSLLLIEKYSPCSGGSAFPLSLSEWSFAI